MSNRGILDVDLSTLSGWLSGGLRWWMGELADLVPQTMRDWAAARRKLADYRPDTGEILVRFGCGGDKAGHRNAGAVLSVAE